MRLIFHNICMVVWFPHFLMVEEENIGRLIRITVFFPHCYIASCKVLCVFPSNVASCGSMLRKLKEVAVHLGATSCLDYRSVATVSERDISREALSYEFQKSCMLLSFLSFSSARANCRYRYHPRCLSRSAPQTLE